MTKPTYEIARVYQLTGSGFFGASEEMWFVDRVEISSTTEQPLRFHPTGSQPWQDVVMSAPWRVIFTNQPPKVVKRGNRA